MILSAYLLCDSFPEVFNAPKRRVDNEISRLADSAALLQMYCLIIQDLHNRYRSSIFRYQMSLGVCAVATVSVPGGMITLGMPMEAAGAAGGIGLVGIGIMNYLRSKSAEDFAQQLISSATVEATFKRLYARKIAEKDEFTLALWTRISEYLRIGLSAAELQAFSKVTSSDLSEIEKILDVEVPAMRRAAGPIFHKKVL